MNRDLTSREWPAAADGAFRGARGILALLAGVFSLLFVFSHVFGGFVLDTPLGAIKCRESAKLMWESLAFWAAWSGLGWLRYRGMPVEQGRPPGLSPGGAGAVTALLIVLNLLLWLRSLYRSYERYLLGMSSVIRVPFWQSHLLWATVAVGTVFVWRRLRQSDGDVAGAVAALLFALSPMAFYVSPTMAYGYVVLVVVWIACTAAARFMTTRAAGIGVAVIFAAVIVWVLATGKGWGGARVTDRFVTRSAPELSAWLALAGLIAWRFTRGRARPYLPVTLALAAVGIAVAGARELVGDVGALMLLPCAVVASGVGAAFLWRNTPLGRTALGRNLLVVLVVGILMGTAKAGIDRGIRAPEYAQDRSEDEPVARPVATPEME